MSRRVLTLTLCAVSLLALGCQPKSNLSGLVPVTGTVTLKGAPLAGAAVVFAPAPPSTARASSATTDANGKFKLSTLKSDDGAFPGDYIVTILKTETVGKTYTPEEANEYYNKNMKSPPPPEQKNLVNVKFAKVDTSPLKATIEKDKKNEFKFDVD